VVVTGKTWREGWRPGNGQARVGAHGLLAGLRGGIAGFYRGSGFSAVMQARPAPCACLRCPPVRPQTQLFVRKFVR
jgi:hypothetical protein